MWIRILIPVRNLEEDFENITLADNMISSRNTNLLENKACPSHGSILHITETQMFEKQQILILLCL